MIDMNDKNIFDYVKQKANQDESVYATNSVMTKDPRSCISYFRINHLKILSKRTSMSFYLYAFLLSNVRGVKSD